MAGTFERFAPIQIIQGGQWGSEAKGMVAAELCRRQNIQWAVRTGAVNAGHTVWHKGKEWKMQQLPVGWVNPDTKIVVGAGAFIYPEILLREIDLVKTVDPQIVKRLYIDYRANLHLPDHQEQARLENRHHAIGATGKGCSVAITDKIRYRGKGYKQFLGWLKESVYSSMAQELQFVDTEHILNDAYDRGEPIQLEGTQGTLLDLHLGPYPYTTHKQTGPAQWCMEAGLSPTLEYSVILVCRTYPIRVAGNSGPMPQEMSWADLAVLINGRMMLHGGQPLVHAEALTEWHKAITQVAADAPDGWLPKSQIGTPQFQIHMFSPEQREKYKVAVSELHAEALKILKPVYRKELEKLFEMTTVTRKLRRIAAWDQETMKAVVRQTRPDSIALTFLNYQFPQVWNVDGGIQEPDILGYVRRIEEELKTEVGWVSTGREGYCLLEKSQFEGREGYFNPEALKQLKEGVGENAHDSTGADNGNVARSTSTATEDAGPEQREGSGRLADSNSKLERSAGAGTDTHAARSKRPSRG